MYYAHSTDDLTAQNWQVLVDHLRGTGRKAQASSEQFGCGPAGYLAGLLHDVGKYTSAFQSRLRGGPAVDHATAGAYEILEMARGPEEKMIAELLAYAIAGHHTGLPDRRGAGSTLDERLKDYGNQEPLDPVWRKELDPSLVGIGLRQHFVKERMPFQLAFLGRMLFSCLVDADYRDTEAFYAQVEGREIDRDWPALSSHIDSLIARFDAYVAHKQAQAKTSSVNDVRRRVLSHARAKAILSPGLFTLTVPTGGGKTLTSLGFALDHVRRHGLRRIIYAVPFTAIIDQTARIFRDVLGGEVVLEHSSAIDEEGERRGGPREQRDKLRLAMEDWAAPVIVTTNVQLFESLFASRPSRCRKLSNLAGSVIVLDEAQTIPLPLLRPCVAALDELARNYGVSIVLCTATQPALATPKFDGGLTLAPERELAPDPKGLAESLRRVTIRHAGVVTDEVLVAALAGHQQGLVIVNSRAHALALFRQALDRRLEGLIHLTTRQYAAHRRARLAEVRKRLSDGAPCRLIATSLVEAGVDLDFPAVWRAEAGLDQIAQAAGRCNREGRHAADESIVTVFTASDHLPPHEIRQMTEAFRRMADSHDDWLSPEAIEAYFREVYWVKGDGLDAKNIMASFGAHRGGTDFAYRTVSERFRMIESGMVPVIVAREPLAKAALARLANPETSPGAAARAVQPYIVQVPPKARALLLANGHVSFECERNFGDQFAVLRRDGLYTDETGLLWEEAGYLELEQLIF